MNEKENIAYLSNAIIDQAKEKQILVKWNLEFLSIMDEVLKRHYKTMSKD